MFKINLKKPLVLSMEMIETDDRIPAMCMDVSILISQFQMVSNYKFCIWIECSQWTDFISKINENSDEKITLKDMNEGFFIALSTINNKTFLSCESVTRDLDCGRTSAMQFRSEIHGDDFSAIRNEFSEFICWW